jgi:ATP-binding cassette subfamily F protein 3
MILFSQISLRRGRKLLFENVSFQVHAGQRVGVIGANGSGKTSLFSMIQGEIEADGGEFRLNARDRIAQVSQESPSTDKAALEYVMDGDEELRSLQKSIARREKSGHNEALHDLFEKFDAIDGYTAETRAARLLHGLGFSDEGMKQPVRTFSGGWRMRLNLAQALMCRSDILLLDEPTNHLDLPAILWLERWLKRYEGILLLVSHDRDFLDNVCTRIAHIEHQGIRVYSGNYSQFEQLRSEQLAQQQALYLRQQKEIRHIQSYVDRFRYKASKARQAQSRLKMLERMTQIAPAHVDSPFRFHFLEPEKQPQHLLQLEDVDAGYEKTVLSNVRMGLAAGDRIGLLGVNGAGKSTLVKALASGETLLAGQRIVGKETRIGYFAQHQLDQLNPDESPLDHLKRLAPDEREQELRNFLGGFGFSGERIFDPVAPFSGGEKARLVLALLIRDRPNLLLLDEPTNHLDLEMRQALSVALVEYSGALVVISHDRHLLRSVCDELLLVHDCTVDRFDQSLDEYPAWLKAQELRSQSTAGLSESVARPRPISRKQERQAQAQRRQHLKPLTDRVRGIERKLAENRMELEFLEKKLAEEALYTDPGRKEELTEMIRQQAAVRAGIESLEWEWLEASEAVDRADKD